VWTKIAAVANQYSPERGKAGSFIGTVATNSIADFFRVNDNRERLAPMVPMIEGDKNRAAAAPATKPEEILPAKATAPLPNGDAVDARRAGWDKKTGRAWAK
jgi:hypothetical protein